MPLAMQAILLGCLGAGSTLRAEQRPNNRIWGEIQPALAGPSLQELLNFDRRTQYH